jgi:hypothetical protein
LTFAPKWGDRQSLQRDSGECVLDVNIGTPGLPTRNSNSGVFAPLTTSEVPADVHPTAHIEFPNKVPGQPPIRLCVWLDRRC